MYAELTYIHVMAQLLRHNEQIGTRNPPLVVLRFVGSKWEQTLCSEVEIKGPSKIIYKPHKPLVTGAVAWIETEADVITDEDRGVL